MHWSSCFRSFSERGAALIGALIVLSFLALLGGALLSSVSMDIRIDGRYRDDLQLLYVAESGIEEAREALRTSALSPSQMLLRAAGQDRTLSLSRDLSVLLAGDDTPMVDGGNRTTGKQLDDLAGLHAGRYFVFLRNDAADGAASPTDTNQILTLVSIAVSGSAQKVLEATVMKGRFPPIPAALTLDGLPAVLMPADAIHAVSGTDFSGTGRNLDAIGIIESGSPAGSVSAAGAAIARVEDALDPRLKSPGGLERMVDRILANATDVFDPGWNGTANPGRAGSPAEPRIVVVNGDCEAGPGTGYGLLLARGNLKLHGDFRWNGLILAIGQGSVEWLEGAAGQVEGAVFVAGTRENDRGPENTLGTQRASRGPVRAVFQNGRAEGVQSGVIQYNEANVELANRLFPYITIATREY